MSVALSVVGLLACSGVPSDGAETGAGAATYPVFEPDGIEIAVVPEMPTQLEVTWDPDPDALQFVEFGYDEAYGTLATEVDGERGRAVLSGIKAETGVHLRILTVRDGEVYGSSDLTAATGVLPAGLPQVSVDVAADPALHEKFVMVPVFDESTGDSVVLVLDHDCDVVWWELVPHANVMSAHRAEEGRALLYRTDDTQRPERGEVTRARWDGTHRETWASPGGHHDVAEIEPGVVAVLEEDIREWEGETLVGDRLVEYSPDGEATVVWSAWDWVEPERTEAWELSVNPRGVDWTHANGIDHDPETGTYLVSMAAVATIVRVSRSTGEVEWALGGTASDYAIVGDPGFGPQHAPVMDGDGVWMFDNHNFVVDAGSAASRIARFALDDTRHEATVAWEWTDPEETLITDALGDVQPLSGGAVFSSWGLLGRVVVVNPSGETAWQFRLGAGQVLGRGEMFRGFYGLEDVELPE